jgi:hypothetical protein
MITYGMELERSTISPAAGDHPFFPSLDRALIERVACTAPEAYELEALKEKKLKSKSRLARPLRIYSKRCNESLLLGWEGRLRRPILASRVVHQNAESE